MLKSMTFRATLTIFACGITASAYAIADTPRKVDVPAGELSVALQKLAEQSGVEFVYSAEQLKGVRTDGVQGEYTADKAVTKLLEGTPLKLTIHESGALLISDVNASGSSRPPPATGFSVMAPVTTPPSSELSAVPAEKEAPKSLWKRFRLAQNDSNAKTSQTGAGTDQADKSEILTLETIIVTAQRRAERLQEVPIAISVLGGDALDDTRAFGGGMEILTRTPALNVRPGVNTLGVRGVSAAPETYQGPTTTALYLDGVPFSFVKNSWLPNLSVYDLDRIEVLRGPQGTLYGASALNGVVRVLTRDPDMSKVEFKARTVLSATQDSDHNNEGADLAVNLPLVTDKLAVRAALGRENYAGWVDTPLGSDRNNLERENLRFKVAAQPVGNLKIVGSVWSYHEERDNPDAGITAERSEYLQDRPASNEFDNYSLKLSYDFGPVSITSDSSYIDYNSGTLDYLLGPGSDDPSWYFFTGAESKILSEEISINSADSGDLRWSVGAFYRHAEDNLFQTLPAVIAAPVNFDDNSESWAVFGEATKVLADGRFELTGGLRYFRDHVEQIEATKLFPTPVPPVNVDRSFDSWSPRLVLSWLPSSDLSLYASIGKGFRSGYGQNIISFYTDPNLPFVEPDYLLNYEVGAKGRAFDGLLDFEAAIYFEDWKDIQTQKTLFVPGTDVQIGGVVNGTSASGIGADLSFGLHPTQGLDITAYASWNDLQQDADVTDPGVIIANKGDRPEDSAEWTAGAALNYGFPLGGSGWNASFSASINYASELLLNVPGAIRATQVVGTDMTAARSSIAFQAPQNWAVTLFAENLTDEDHVQETGLLPFLVGTRTWMRPRTLGVQLDVKF